MADIQHAVCRQMQPQPHPAGVRCRRSSTSSQGATPAWWGLWAQPTLTWLDQATGGHTGDKLRRWAGRLRRVICRCAGAKKSARREAWLVKRLCNSHHGDGVADSWHNSLGLLASARFPAEAPCAEWLCGGVWVQPPADKVVCPQRVWSGP